MKEARLYRIDHELEKEVLLTRVDKDVCIGKSPKADLRIDDWKCNGIHALIQKPVGETCQIIDLGSYYGTKVNDVNVKKSVLLDGDKLKIGDYDLVFRYSEKENSTDKDIVEGFRKNSKYDDPFKPDTHLTSELNVLEIYMHWGDQVIDVKSFHSGNEITIGNPKTSTFGIPLAAAEYFNKDYKIAEYKKNNLKLYIPKEANGIVWTDSKTIALDTMRFYDDKYIGKDVIELDLRRGDRAHLEFGELSLTFKFVSPSDKISMPIIPRLDKTLAKIFLGIALVYLLLGIVFKMQEPELEEKKIKDIPKHLKKIVYQAGIDKAKKQQKAAIGQLAKSEGGRAKSKEGKSSSRTDIKKKIKAEKVKKKKNEKKRPKKAVAKKKPKKQVKSNKVSKKGVAVKPVSIDIDKAFKTSDTSAVVATNTTILSKVKKSGNTASALSENGFARGKSGLGAGGGGKSHGVGALKGGSTGGGLGAGDYGLSPSKGSTIKIPETEDISIQDGLDPDIIAARIRKYLPQIQHCYEQQLVHKPKLRGKVTVGFTILGNGRVGGPLVKETSLRDSAVEKCMIGKIKNWKFPKPKGGGTVGVKYPFILMSNTGK